MSNKKSNNQTTKNTSNITISFAEEAKRALDSIAEMKSDEHPIKSLDWYKLFKMIFNRWFTYTEWVEAGSPKDALHLYKWQEDLVKDVFQPLIDNYEKDDFHIRIAMAGAYGVGKSSALAIIAVMHICYCYMFEKHRTYKGVIYSGSETQLRETLWDEVRVFSLHIDGLVHECEKLYIDRKRIGDRNVNDVNEYRITAETFNLNNKDTKRGKHAGNILVIFDEGTNMSDKMYQTADSFGTMTRRVWLVMSNPTTTVGTFYQLFINDFYQKHWLTKNISVFDSHPEGHNYANEVLDKYPSDDGEESDEVRMYVYGLFPKRSVGAIYSQLLIDEATARPMIAGGVCAIGIDLASGRGRDFSAIGIKRPMCYQSVRKYSMDMNSFMKTVVFDHIISLRPSFVAIDRGGIGEGPAHDLIAFCEAYNIKVVPVDFGGRSYDLRYINRRTELLFKFRERLLDGYSLCDSQELRDEMTRLTYGSEYGKIRAVSKKDLPKSTDLLDALILTEASDLMSPALVKREHTMRQQRLAQEPWLIPVDQPHIPDQW